MGGFCEENTRDKKKARETKRKHQHQKEQKAHTFKGASRKPQLKDCKLKQDASTKQKEKEHDTKSTCEGFHTKPLYGRFCDGKKMRAN